MLLCKGWDLEYYHQGRREVGGEGEASLCYCYCFCYCYLLFVICDDDEDWAASKPYTDGESVRIIVFVIWMMIGTIIDCDDHEDCSTSMPYRVGKDYDYSEHNFCHLGDCWDNHEQAKMGSWFDVDAKVF